MEDARSLFGLIAHATHRFVSVIPLCLNAMSSFPVVWSYVQWRYEVVVTNIKIEMRNINLKFLTMLMFLMIMLCYFVFVLGWIESEEEVVRLEREEKGVNIESWWVWVVEWLMSNDD
ncbi:hypothetical protein MtrunA17_Chr2g0290141 [Medicago truncatula]|uniref:Transmembrane protein n=1 Tax=Medicago truncatula TaxID=3880 RepID=A0A396J3P1_MEDTR|nr:hypothetical protein MtrunA17_Chr2g0290141 [Medicago truncatula]